MGDLGPLFARANDAYIERGTSRRQGRTFRSVLWALLNASRFPDKRSVHLSSNSEGARQAFQMACNVVSSIQVTVKPESLSIEFPNNSVLCFRGPKPDDFSGQLFNFVSTDCI